MSAPLEEGMLSPDVRAALVDRKYEWEKDWPWYKRAAAPLLEVPLYLALERLVRERGAELERAKASLVAMAKRYRRVRIALACLQNDRGERRARDKRAKAEARSLRAAARRAALGLLALQHRRDADAREIDEYRGMICWETTCRTCSHLLTQLYDLDEGPAGVRALRRDRAAAHARLREARDCLMAGVEALADAGDLCPAHFDDALHACDAALALLRTDPTKGQDSP